MLLLSSCCCCCAVYGAAVLVLQTPTPLCFANKPLQIQAAIKAAGAALLSIAERCPLPVCYVSMCLVLAIGSEVNNINGVYRVGGFCSRQTQQRQQSQWWYS